MVEKDTRKLAQMGRRRFLKNLTIAGISATTLNYISQETLAKQTSSLDEKIPVVKHEAKKHPDIVERDRKPNGQAPVYEWVPKDTWDRHQHRQKTQTKIRNHLRNNGFEDVGVGSKVVKKGESAIKVSASPENIQEIRETLPKTINIDDGDGNIIESTDILVEKNTIEKWGSKSSMWPPDGDYYTDNYDPVPAGVMMSAYFGNNDQDPSTLGTPAYHKGLDDDVWVTAGHNLDDNNNSVFQPWDNLNNIGLDHRIGGKYRASEDNHFDAGIIQRGGDEEATYHMADNNGSASNIEITGTTSKDLMKYYADQGWDYRLKRQGMYTLRSNSDFKVTNYDDKYYSVGGRPIDVVTRFETEPYGEKGSKGDSGSPMFDQPGNYSYIAGIFFGVKRDNDRHVFTSINDITEQYNLRIPR